jgi:hypothetical protein
MRCHERKALQWWLLFERARRAEIRRNPEGESMYNMMALPELGLHEARIHSPDLVNRIQRIKLTKALRDRARPNRRVKPIEGQMRTLIESVFGVSKSERGTG